METVKDVQEGYVSPEICVFAIDLSQVIAQSSLVGRGNEEFGNDPGDPIDWDNLAV